MTEYVVLIARYDSDPETTMPAELWQELGRTEAASSEAAIRAVVATNAAGASKQDSFVAVPVRSWVPVGAEIDPNPVVKLSKR